MDDANRAMLELGGQRAAMFADECLRRNGYGPADMAFREIGAAMLDQRATKYGLEGDTRTVWLTSANRHLDDLAAGRAIGEGAQ
ncbi:hypothetical protein DA075_35560 (plasmid) [Methylobacterium currus]|uniref:Uncharacterized protein n=1 Tax=Methylobacterium currus TaxID=2051553 RepID=A0A2R4WXE3_9HYPH|nr:hypothetical protein [Methylobacterium currus]AWB26190.1 hypothetical protein DA075_35560 [Methylobacterium currus]